MAMSILNNATAMLSLGELNKNISNMGRQQKKLSSGMKINSAGDDASAYAISERMRVKLRALDQDVDNVKTGTTLLNVAGGAIDNIIDELRNMKEMAINSANDHNTDQDRAILQKEFEQKMQNIEDIASSTNYNGRYLLNGNYNSPRTYWGVVTKQGDPQTTTLVVGQRLEKVKIGTTKVQVGMDLIRKSDQNTVQGLTSAFKVANSSTYALPKGREDSSLKECSSVLSIGSFSTEPLAVKIDFSGMKKENGEEINIPGDLHEQGFSILCAACKDQFITVKFDATTDDSTYVSSLPNEESSVTFTIGIKSVTNAKDLEAAVFNGIKNAPGRPKDTSEWHGNGTWGATTPPDTDTSVIIDIHHNVRIAENPNGDGYVFLKGSTGGPYGDKYFTPNAGFYDIGTIQDVFVPKYKEEPIWEEQWVPETKTVTTYSLIHTEEWIDDPGNPLIIHHGTKANENLHVFINNMHTDAMGLIGTKIDNGKDALWALSDAKTGRVGAIDAAIEYALGEATNIGAYITRLEFTEENLVTANENTQSAESVIRDSNMAKEMTGFTKSSILSQTAQAMLAQANQNSSQVISLLQ